MRSVLGIGIFVVLLSAPLAGSGATTLDQKPADAASIAAIETRIAQSQPREQCLLYAQLVHEMIEFSSAQYALGEVEIANAMLARVDGLAAKLHMRVTSDEKHLKDAQILLRHTTYRLTEMLRTSADEDRPLMEHALAQLNQIQSEAMLAVFKR